MMENRINRVMRVLSLMKKEVKQIVRDPSSIIIAFILPLMLLLLFGYGVSLDLKNISIGVVIEDQSADSNDLLHAFLNSPYFKVRVSRYRKELEPLLTGGRLNAVVVIPSNFTELLYSRGGSPIQVIVRGTDENTGELVLNYIEMTWRKWLEQESVIRGNRLSVNLVNVEPRVWFNEEVESRAALLPGSIAIIMTLIGTMLTSLVIAREWERGTMEALLATEVTPGELLLGKFVPYFALGMLAMGMVTGVSTLFMGVPFRGSVWLLLVVSSVFLLYALGLGFLISAVTRNQFVATQISLIVGFLPAFILSGLVFEISSMPWAIRYLTYLLAPRYFVSSLRTLFLVGNVWQVILPDTLVMGVWGVLLLILTFKSMPRTLER